MLVFWVERNYRTTLIRQLQRLTARIEGCQSSILTINLMASESINEFLVSKETVKLRRWERSKQKFGFIKRVDKG